MNNFTFSFSIFQSVTTSIPCITIISFLKPIKYFSSYIASKLYGVDATIIIFVFVLYCIVLYCIVLYCIVLYCIVLYCIVLYCIVLYCIVLYCIVLYCIVLYCIVYCSFNHKNSPQAKFGIVGN